MVANFRIIKTIVLYLILGSLQVSAYEINTEKYRACFEKGVFSYYSQGSTKTDFRYSIEYVSCGDRIFRCREIKNERHSANTVSYDYGAIVTETYIALPNGVEQCWMIKNCPRLSGDIVIQGKVASPHRVSSSLDGTCFHNGRGQTIFKYGKVTVIDGNGQKYGCLPHFIGGKLRITIPADFVKNARFPILVDPVVGPEIPVSFMNGPATGNQESVAIAASPGGYLMVWQDGRGPDIDIFGCRIGSDGRIIDSIGIPISTADGDQLNPSVAWNGREYLVVWADRREGIQHIYGARVRPDGEVIDPSGIAISGTTGTQSLPDVASDGYGWLVVWQDTKSQNLDIYGCKIGMDGSKGTPVGITTRLDNEETPSVAYCGSTYLVVWKDYRNSATADSDIYGCRVSRSGVRTGSDILISCATNGTSGASGAQRYPVVSASTGSYMVVWEDLRNTATGIDVYGTRVNTSGTVQDKGGIAISRASGDQEVPCIGFNGSKFLVAWRLAGERTIWGARLSTSGGVLDTNGVKLSSTAAGAYAATVSGYNNIFFIGWSSFDAVNAEIMSEFVTDSGAPQNLAGTVVSLSVDVYGNAAVAFNGTEYAVVWSQKVNGSYDILGVRFSGAGELLTQTPVNITRTYAGDQVEPAIAWNGSRYLLVWTSNDSYIASQWDIKGCLLDSVLNRTSSVTISAAILNQKNAAVTVGGSTFFVVWEDSRDAISPTYYSNIYGALVSNTGTVTAAKSPVCSADNHQINPRAASTGSNFMAIWEDYRSAYPLVYATRVSNTGVVQDTNGIVMPGTSKNKTKPDISYGGGNFFAVWSENTKIAATRISVAGVVLDTSGITVDSGAKAKLATNLYWDGTKFQVVWEDYRSSGTGNSDIYHTTVASNGNVSSLPKMALISDLKPQFAPKIISNGMTGLLVYSKFINHYNYICAASLVEQLVQQVENIALAKNAPNGTQVSISDMVVTASFSDCFYIEDADRTNGLKVVWNQIVPRDGIVRVVGSMANSDGERQLVATGVDILGTSLNPPAALAVRGDWIGGGNYGGLVGGVTGGVGLNNIGLLVTTWGKVTVSSSSSFNIECVPGISIKVKSGTLVRPAVGKSVCVTGIATCELFGGAVIRSVRPRDQADIRVLN